MASVFALAISRLRNSLHSLILKSYVAAFRHGRWRAEEDRVRQRILLFCMNTKATLVMSPVQVSAFGKTYPRSLIDSILVGCSSMRADVHMRLAAARFLPFAPKPNRTTSIRTRRHRMGARKSRLLGRNRRQHQETVRMQRFLCSTIFIIAFHSSFITFHCFRHFPNHQSRKNAEQTRTPRHQNSVPSKT